MTQPSKEYTIKNSQDVVKEQDTETYMLCQSVDFRLRKSADFLLKK